MNNVDTDRSKSANIGWSVRVGAALLAASVRVALGASDDLTQLDLATLMQMDVTLVTAQRRIENVNTVPISMTVLKTDAIRGLRLTGTPDLQLAVAGLTTSSNVGFTLPHIRGIGTDINSSGVEPSVAVYVDGIYQTERTQAFVPLADTEQIEILRGPQGTLYGRNSSGGAINITTRGPSEQFVSDVRVSTGNLNSREGAFFAAGPLNERVRTSFSAQARQRDGYYKNIIDGQDVNDENYYSLSGRAQVDLSPEWRAEALVRHFHRNDSIAYATEVSGNSIPALLGVPVGRKPYETASDLTSDTNGVNSTITALRLDGSVSGLQLKSISSYNDIRHTLVLDIDASAAQLANMDIGEVTHTFTQEVQVSPTDAPERFNWLLGGFYIRSSDQKEPFAIATTVPGMGLATQRVGGQVDTRAEALFGEVTYAATAAFSLTAGLRYSYEDKALVQRVAGFEGAPLQTFPSLSTHWDDLNYRLVAKYTTDRYMLYAKTETGFKTGAYNNINQAHTGPIRPEEVTAYELGAKTAVANLPLWLNAAAFFNDVRGLQVQVIDGVDGVTQILSAPHAESYGLDFNLEAKPSEHWNLRTGLTWQQAHYNEFLASGVLVPSPSGGHTSAVNLDLAGNTLPRSPRLTANAIASFDYPLLGGAVFGSALYSYSSRMYFEPTNVYSQPAVDMINASFGYRSPARWNVTAWVKNLADHKRFLTILPTPVSAFGQYAEPRTYGVSLGYSFAP